MFNQFFVDTLILHYIVIILLYSTLDIYTVKRAWNCSGEAFQPRLLILLVIEGDIRLGIGATCVIRDCQSPVLMMVPDVMGEDLSAHTSIRVTIMFCPIGILAYINTASPYDDISVFHGYRFAVMHCDIHTSTWMHIKVMVGLGVILINRDMELRCFDVWW